MTDRMKTSNDKLKGTKDRSNFGQSSNQKLPQNIDKSASKSGERASGSGRDKSSF